MHGQTKATAISKSVRCAVYERDGYRCIICGSSQGQPNAHYIARSQGGLGVEENIVTLCPCCHRDYDQSCKRKVYKDFIKSYLKNKYPEWDENKLIYRKWRF